MLYPRKCKEEEAHPFRGNLEVFAESESERHWCLYLDQTGRLDPGNQRAFSVLPTSLHTIGP